MVAAGAVPQWPPACADCKSNKSMAEKLKKLQTESAIKKLKDNQLRQDYEDARAILDRIPPEILRQYRSRANNQKQEIHR